MAQPRAVHQGPDLQVFPDSPPEVKDGPPEVTTTPAPEPSAPPRAASAREFPAPESPAEAVPARKSSATRTPADKAPVEKVPAPKAPPKKAAAKKAPAKKAPAKKAPAEKATAKKAAAGAGKTASTTVEVPVKAAAAAKKVAAKPVGETPAKAAKTPAPRPAPKNVVPKNRPRPVPDVTGPSAPAELPVRPARPAVVRATPAAGTSTGRARPHTPRPARPGSTRAGAPAARPRRRPAQVTPITAIRPAPEEAAEPSRAAGIDPGRFEAAAALAQQAGQRLLDILGSGPRVPADLETKVAGVLEFMRKRLTGEYEVDEFGFDPEFADAVVLNLLTPLYDHWFRVEVRGAENLPADGGALVVANHSGTVALDSIMVAVAVRKSSPQGRHLRMLGADLVFDLPMVGQLARRSGATLATNTDAERLLSTGQLVGVWPEGFKGVGKPFSERYKLQRFGRGGFVTAALRTGVPIIPCSVVGAEEIYPMIGNVPSLARLFGLPYLPITPTFPLLGPLGLVPLPSKWLIEFSPPVPTAEYENGAADDPMLVFDLTDQVRQTIQQTLYSLLVQRRSVFF